MQHLAVVTPENGVALFELRETGWLPRAVLDHSLWPAPRPGADDWIASRVVTGATSLVLAESDAEVPGSRTEPPLLMGPRLPHYSLWSPGGERIAYVVPDGRSLTLKVVTMETGEVRDLLSASPLFPAWLGGGGWLLCHHGATLTAFDLEAGEQRVLSTSASGFRTPACAHDGSVAAWSEVREGSVHVMAGPVQSEPTEVARFGGGVALAFRPGTRQLYAAVAESPETGVFSEIVSLDLAGGAPRRVLRGPLVAWWWDPAGDRLAVLLPTYSGDGRFQLRIYDNEGRFLRASEGFIPSNDTATVVSFFDQYALSHPAWSADGRWFGFAGRFQTDSPHPSFSGGGGDTAWAWDTRETGGVHSLGRGQLVVFGGQ